MRIKKVKTVPRGYRLKPETHKLIARIQKIMNANAEEVINTACKKHYVDLKISSKNGKEYNK